MDAARIILTGAPGTGKSTLLAALAEVGWSVSPEVAREVIAAEQAGGGRRTPWEDLGGFLAECRRRMARRRAGAAAGTVFDRAEPDLWAYARVGGIDWPPPPPAVVSGYAREVIYAPLWREIFWPDAQRRQTWADAVALDRELRRVYQELGYIVRELPRADVGTRAGEVVARWGAAGEGRWAWAG